MHIHLLKFPIHSGMFNGNVAVGPLTGPGPIFEIDDAGCFFQVFYCRDEQVLLLLDQRQHMPMPRDESLLSSHC